MTDGKKLYDMDYKNNFACLFESTEHVQQSLDRLARDVAGFSIYLHPQSVKYRCRAGRL